MKELLPIGSIITMKGSDRKIMVIGYLVNVDDPKMTFDYRGCFYPKGIIVSNDGILFNHNQIDKVIYKGYSNEEDKEFKEKINDYFKKEGNKNE